MYQVRVPARFKNPPSRPLAKPKPSSLDLAWREVEGVLASPRRLQNRRARSWGSQRVVTGFAFLIASGGLALASWGALHHACDGILCASAQSAPEVASASAFPKIAMAHERRTGADVAEGRSAAETPDLRTNPRDKASPGPVASSTSTTDDNDLVRGRTADTPAGHRGSRRHRHHDWRAGLAYRQAWR